jgi:glycosyltransferase involved in cell wall biosynthesis
VLAGSGAGFLATKPADWVAYLRELIDDATLRRRMGEAAREHAVQHYSVASVIDRYMDIFHAVARR